MLRNCSGEYLVPVLAPLRRRQSGFELFDLPGNLGGVTDVFADTLDALTSCGIVVKANQQMLGLWVFL